MKRILHLLFKKRTAAKTDLENQLKGTRKEHSHKKQKDSNLERQAVLLILSLEPEISGVTVQRIQQQKMMAFARHCSLKMTLRLFYVVITMMSTLLREFIRSLQIKKIIIKHSWYVIVS